MKMEDKKRVNDKKRQAEDLSIDMHFAEGFDPKKSKRTENKTMFDGAGRYRNGRDVCDCLDNKCVGCHFPCRNCGNTKCGNECRRYRSYAYESIKVEGQSYVRRNTNI